jgi:hypothetical protein
MADGEHNLDVIQARLQELLLASKALPSNSDARIDVIVSAFAYIMEYPSLLRDERRLARSLYAKALELEKDAPGRFNHLLMPLGVFSGIREGR